MAIQPLSQPEADGRDGDEAAIVGEQLVVAGGDPAELLELVDEPLDEVALGAEAKVAARAPASVGPRGDGRTREREREREREAEVVAVVGPIGDDVLWPEPVDRAVGEEDVAPVTGRDDRADGQPEGIGRAVELGGRPAARAAEAAGPRRPLFSGARRPPADEPSRWWNRPGSTPGRPRRPVPRTGGRARRRRPSGSSDA